LQTAQSRGAEAIHYCLSWGPAALDLHEHLQPGDRLMIEGVLQYRWKKGPSGKKLRVAEIVVKGYTYLGRGDLVQFSRKEHLVR
jgi:single-stranded DNA-binding protein